MRAVLADGHPLLLDGLQQLLCRQGGIEVVARCGNGETALRAVLDLRPEVLVCELRLAGLDGLALVAALQAAGSPTRPVIYAADVSEQELIAAMRLGVRGVVLKEMPPRLLLECLQKVAAGECWLERKATVKALRRLAQAPAPSTATNDLTRRELEIARVAARGLSNKEIAAELAIREGTVKVHIHSLYRKLGVANRVALLRAVEREGLG